jgi:hypothetical protein
MVALSRFASSSPVVAFPKKVNAGTSRKSAEILSLQLAQLSRGLPTATLPFGHAAGQMIRDCFWSRSQHRTAIVASQALGASPDTIDRIIGGDTNRIDAQLLFRCLAVYQDKFGRPFPFRGGLGIAIVEVAE